MDFTFLDKCFLAIRPETWKRVNELLGQYGVAQERSARKVIRTDTTVVESNIHYPTDSSLLWDTWRVASRLLHGQERSIRRVAPPLPRPQDQAAAPVHHPLHAQQVEVPPAEGESDLPHADRADGLDRGDCRGILPRAAAQGNAALAAVALELKAYLPSMQTVVATARRAQVAGETVPASERVFSLFEQHTELIKRGKRQKPVEFGHKVLLCESAEKFITDYEVYEKQQADCELTEAVIERHENLFGARPEVLAADKGFCPAEAKFEELAEQVETLAIPRRMQDFVDKVLAHWQAFRAGIEGTISGLKRAFRLVRCFFRGFRSFAAAVGLGVFCHNLIVLADHASG